jgi:hypothetical protein
VQIELNDLEDPLAYLHGTLPVAARTRRSSVKADIARAMPRVADHQLLPGPQPPHEKPRLGGLVALDASSISYQWAVQAALAAGATVDDIVGTLIAVAPISGLARVISAIPEVAVALGYDIDQAFEEIDRDPRD